MRTMRAPAAAVAMLCLLGWAPGVPAAAASAADRIAGGWIYLEYVPGSGACGARLAGEQVDTMLGFDARGELLLMAGRPDWQASGPERIALGVDGFEVDHLTANAAHNLIVLPLRDAMLIRRLSTARELDWYLPSGQYRARVAGLGRALRWLQSCRRDKRAAR